MIIRLKNKISLSSTLATLGLHWGLNTWLMERHAPLAWYSVRRVDLIMMSKYVVGKGERKRS